MRLALSALLLSGLVVTGLSAGVGEEAPAAAPAPWVQDETLAIHRFETTCNTFFLTCNATKAFVIIDAGAGIWPAIQAHVARGHTLKALWVTHDHGDHLSGLGDLAKRVEVPILAHRAGKEAIEEVRSGWEGWGMTEIAPEPPARPTVWIEDGANLTVGKVEVKGLFAPGHSRGSVGFLANGRFLFAGDVLFRGSVGRTDFPGCDHDRFCRSLSEKLWDLPDATVVLPGHGDRTTIGEEKRSNWLFQDYVRAARGEEPIARPWVGIGIDRERKEPGIGLTEVREGSPAEKAGLRVGDVVVSFGGVETNAVEGLWTVLRRSKPGDEVEVILVRDEEKVTLRLTLGRRPPR